MPEHSRLQLISMSAIALCSEKNTAVSSLKCVCCCLLVVSTGQDIVPC